MSETTPYRLKEMAKYAGFALLGSLGTMVAKDNTVQYIMPKGTEVSFEDNCGTDGSNHDRVFVVMQVPHVDGSIKETRVRKSEIANQPEPGKPVE